MSERLTPEREAEIEARWEHTLDDDIGDTLDEIDRLREDNKALLMTIELLREGWDETIAKNKALREALRFYANENNYCENGSLAIDEEGWTRARAALERTK